MTSVWITFIWLNIGKSSIETIAGLNHVHVTQQSCEKMIAEVFKKSKAECRELQIVDITK